MTVQVNEPAKAIKDKKSADQVLFTVDGELSFTYVYSYSRLNL